MEGLLSSCSGGNRRQRTEAITMTKLSEYMHTAQAAEHLGVHHNTIRNWAARGELPMHRNSVSGYRLCKKSDLDKFLKKTARPITRPITRPIKGHQLKPIAKNTSAWL